MAYRPSVDTDQVFLKPETSPVFLASAASSSQDFQAQGYQSAPAPTHPEDNAYRHATVPKVEDDSYNCHDMVKYPLPARFPIPHGYVHDNGLGSEQVEHCQVVSQGNGLEVVMANHKPPGTKRGPFKNQEKRQQTAYVRKIGSCIRCRMQRIRVGEDTDEFNVCADSALVRNQH